MVPVTLLIAASGIAFGPVLGFAYAALGAFSSAAFSFYVGRTVGREPVRRLGGPYLNRISRRLARSGIVAVTLLRLLPIAPFTLVNVVAGAMQLRFRDFFAGTVLGMTPGIVLMTRIGRQRRAGAALWRHAQSADIRRGDSRPRRLRLCAAALARRRRGSSSVIHRRRRQSREAEGGDARPLVVATYNIHTCVGVDRRYDPDRTAAVLRELGPTSSGCRKSMRATASAAISISGTISPRRPGSTRCPAPMSPIIADASATRC